MENFKNALQSLATLKKIDDYGMFQMTYFGDYGFDEFLKVGINEADNIGSSLFMKHLLTGIPINYTPTPGAGCTVFTARNDKDEILFCRNFDFSYNGVAYSPSLQLFTSPDNGYTSVSTVNLLYFGYGKDNLPNGLNLESFPVLDSPYCPMDGVNAKGVAIAILALPEAKPAYDTNKIMLDTPTTMRLILDKATNVEEALGLLRQYNICFPMNIYCQFLIADASGRSVIVNYYDDDMKITEVGESYQIASNFASFSQDICAGRCEFERYDKVKSTLASNGGVLTEAQAVDLLADVGVVYEGESHIQWSVIYNLSTLEGVIFAHGKKDNLINFHITP